MLNKLYQNDKRFPKNQYHSLQRYDIRILQTRLSIHVISYLILPSSFFLFVFFLFKYVSFGNHGVSLSYLFYIWESELQCISTQPNMKNATQICHIKSHGSHSVVVLALKLDRSTHRMDYTCILNVDGPLGVFRFPFLTYTCSPSHEWTGLTFGPGHPYDGAT